MLGAHYMLLGMPIVNDSVGKSMKGFTLFSRYNSQVLSPSV